MMPVCRSKVCAGAQTTSYDTLVPLSTSVATPINAVPYTVTSARTSSAAIVFTGSLTAGDTPVNVTLSLTYTNTAVPSIVVNQVVPVVVTVPANSTTPVAVSLDASLPCGVYNINLNLQGSAAVTIGVHGSLGVSFTYG
jgi:hypothetical protein